ncbi:hypothetical protein Scep_011299 [Stephania cephalantha]|uniref:Uncharacterized protein n=1 Tax=Stephania cephalantha TaxID=152367 RepID=A0AAP0P8S1_9MAGN
MKKSGVFVASMAAASATAISSSSDFFANSKKIQQVDRSLDLESQAQEDGENLSSRKSTATEKFAPRFDGLRFIETLVTAHR